MRAYLCLFLFFIPFSVSFGQKYLLEQDVNKDTLPPEFGPRRKYEFSTYIGVGWAAGNSSNQPPSEISYQNSWQFRDGFWFRAKLNRHYAVGALLEYSRESYRLTDPIMGDSAERSQTQWTKQINNHLVAGLFNRFSLKRDKTFLDIGAYFAFDIAPRIQTKVLSNDVDFSYKKTTYHNPSWMNRNNYGIDLRLTYAKVSGYARYRLSGLYKDATYDLPKLMVGLMLDIRD